MLAPCTNEEIYTVIDDFGDEEVQIIAARNDGEGGPDALNERFHERNVRRGAKASFRFAVADSCLWTVNDYDYNRGL